MNSYAFEFAFRCPEGFPRELFINGDAMLRSGQVCVMPGKSVSLDTYFNCFPSWQWARYTDVREVDFELVLSGSGTVCLNVSNSSGEHRVVRELSFECDEFFRVSIANVSLDALATRCFLTVHAAETPVTLMSGGVKAHALPRDVYLACCFCTFMRELELTCNVERLYEGIIANPSSMLNEKLDIYVADNGSTLKRKIHEDNCHVRYYDNPNYGGAAGFTRCMIESCLRSGAPRYSHVLLIDDDATVLPFVVERVASLLSFVNERHSCELVGGARLSSQRPWIQDTGPRLWKGFESRGSQDALDARLQQEVLGRGEDEPNYTCWWFTAIPRSVVQPNNLPLPVFFQGDDVEYGLRAGKSGILAEGVAVWHPTPTVGKSTHQAYYQVRNALIIMSRREAPERAAKLARRLLMKKSIARALAYRYEEASSGIEGARDFLEGPSILTGKDPEKHNSDLISRFAYEVCDVGRNVVVDTPRSPQGRLAVMVRLTIGNVLPAWKVRTYDCDVAWRDVDCLFAREIRFVDSSIGKGVSFKRDRRALLSIIREVRKELRRMLRNPEIFDRWARAASDMQTLSSWLSYLGLEEGYAAFNDENFILN